MMPGAQAGVAGDLARHGFDGAGEFLGSLLVCYHHPFGLGLGRAFRAPDDGGNHHPAGPLYGLHHLGIAEGGRDALLLKQELAG